MNGLEDRSETPNYGQLIKDARFYAHLGEDKFVKYLEDSKELPNAEDFMEYVYWVERAAGVLRRLDHGFPETDIHEHMDRMVLSDTGPNNLWVAKKAAIFVVKTALGA